MNEIQEMAVDLLWVVWRGIDAGYKSKYRRTIWEQFENTVRTASYTNNLGKFANSLCSKLSARLGIKPEEAKVAETILNSGNDKALLKLFRDETTLIVLMVRVRNQERRELYESRETTKITPLGLFEAEEIKMDEELYDEKGNFKSASLAGDIDDYLYTHPDATDEEIRNNLFEQELNKETKE